MLTRNAYLVQERIYPLVQLAVDSRSAALAFWATECSRSWATERLHARTRLNG